MEILVESTEKLTRKWRKGKSRFEGKANKFNLYVQEVAMWKRVEKRTNVESTVIIISVYDFRDFAIFLSAYLILKIDLKIDKKNSNLNVNSEFFNSFYEFIIILYIKELFFVKRN